MLLSLFIISFISALALTPLAIRVGRRYKLVDQPDDQGLKIHQRPMPITGGIVIFTSLFFSFLFCYLFVSMAHQKLLVVTVFCLILLSLGIIDDLKSLNPLIRFALHTLVAIWVVYSGFNINLFNSDLSNYIATVFIIVAVINSINLLDGIDGLATGVSAISSLVFICLSFFQSNIIAQILSITLLGSLIGFLPYNFHPAKIFLGDNGSTIIGFLLALLVVSTTSINQTWLCLFACLFILGLPLLDTGYAIFRRIKDRKSIFLGDREHFYDKLLRRGFNQKQTAFISFGGALICAGIGISLVVLFG